MEKILIVDDEEFFRERLVKAFEKRGYEVVGADSYEEAIAKIEKEKPTHGVFDLKMPGKSGLDLLKTALEIHPLMEVVVLTGYGSIATATEAVRYGAVNYLPKPADVDEILHAFSHEQDDAVEEGIQTPSLARAEWEHINRVLHDCNGNISLAARRLGLHRRTLQRKLQKYPPNK